MLAQFPLQPRPQEEGASTYVRGAAVRPRREEDTTLRKPKGRDRWMAP